MSTSPLAPIERSVRSARRRLFLQALVHRLPVACSIALGVGLAWVVAEPFVGETLLTGYRWYAVGGLVAISAVGAWFWAKRSTPDATNAALEVDSRFELRERLTTAIGLTDAERATPAGAAVMADAAAKVTPIAVRDRFPIRLTWASVGVPALAACVALAAVYPLNTLTDAFAESDGPAKKKMDATEAKTETKPVTPFTQRNKPPELAQRIDKSKELKELEEQINELIRKFDNDPNRESQEKLKEKVTEMTSLEEKVKKFSEEKRDKLEKLEQQLQQLDRLNNDKEFEKGPAKKLNEALQKGDLKGAKDELDQLKKKVQEKKLSEEEKQQLAKQVEKMKEQLQKNDKAKEREEKLKSMIDKAKKEGREQDADSLERELKQAQKDNADSKEASQELAEKLQKAKEALEKGDFEEAAKELEKAGQQLEQTDADLKDLEDAQDYLQRLKDDKKNACKKCQGDCDSDKFEPKDDAEWTNKGQIGAGRRKEDKDAKTNSQDERLKGIFDPRGKKTYGGTTKGPAFKTATTGELGPAIQSAAQEAPAAADSQRLPRDAKDTVKEYFENLGGQNPGGSK
jgi:uncharacterized coiled-coil DUF342 family protein